MKITTLIAAAALATASTTAFADNTVTTQSGETVIVGDTVTKNLAGGEGLLLGLFAAIATAAMALDTKPATGT